MDIIPNQESQTTLQLQEEKEVAQKAAEARKTAEQFF